jgi:hypothetical protein
VRRGCTHEPKRTITRYSSLFEEEITGPDYGGWWVMGTCPYGNCREMNCPVCGCGKGGWGPVGCPCDGWACWPDMRPQLSPTPVKPSAARYRPSRRHRAWH